MKRGACLGTLLVLALGLCPLPEAAAQAALPALAQGRLCLEAGRFEEAVEHLGQAFRDDPASAEVSFLLGQAEFGAGDYEAAAAAFERVLVIQPALDRARLELARSYFHMGLHRVAADLFREVYEKPGTPEGVRRTIDEYLSRLDPARSARCPHTFGGALTVSLARDDNARVTPGGTVTIPGLPRLSVPVERDVFTAQNLVLEHRWRAPSGDLAWASELLGYNALYLDEDDLNVQYLRLDTGPRWTRGRLTLGLGVNGALMEKDDDRYLRSYGARAVAGVTVSRKLVVRLELSGEDRRYWQVSEANGRAGSLALRPTWVCGRHALTADLAVEAHDAEEGWESYDKASAGLGYQLALPWRLTFLSTYAVEAWRFADNEPLAAARRRDTVHAVSVGLRRMLGPRTVVELRHKFETAHSNSDLYDYDRNVTALSLTYGF